MCHLLPVMYGVLANSGSQQWTDTITSTPKFGPLVQKQLLIVPKFCLPLFISFFEARNFGVNSNKTLVDQHTFKCKE